MRTRVLHDSARARTRTAAARRAPHLLKDNGEVQLGVDVVVGRQALPVAVGDASGLVHLELHLHHAFDPVEGVLRWSVELDLTVV